MKVITEMRPETRSRSSIAKKLVAGLLSASLALAMPISASAAETETANTNSNPVFQTMAKTYSEGKTITLTGKVCTVRWKHPSMGWQSTPVLKLDKAANFRVRYALGNGSYKTYKNRRELQIFGSFNLKKYNGKRVSIKGTVQDQCYTQWYVRDVVFNPAAGTSPKIVKAKKAISSVKLSKTKYTYNGKKHTPKVTAKYGKTTLKKDRDYTVTYSKGCKKVGTYKVTVKGKGNYKGSITKTFRIVAKSKG